MLMFYGDSQIYEGPLALLFHWPFLTSFSLREMGQTNCKGHFGQVEDRCLSEGSKYKYDVVYKHLLVVWSLPLPSSSVFIPWLLLLLFVLCSSYFLLLAWTLLNPSPHFPPLFIPEIPPPPCQLKTTLCNRGSGQPPISQHSQLVSASKPCVSLEAPLSVDFVENRSLLLWIHQLADALFVCSFQCRHNQPHISTGLCVLLPHLCCHFLTVETAACCVFTCGCSAWSPSLMMRLMSHVFYQMSL